MQNQLLPELKLPKRYEVLQREAKQRNVDLTGIIQRVDTAAYRTEVLLRQVREGGLGRFELFLGKSGAGKTTFLKTLPKFFDGVSIDSIPEDIELAQISNYISDRAVASTPNHIWVLHDRDNPNTTLEEARKFFESLRVLFRKDEGKIVIIWPITYVALARILSDSAWEIGRDSVVDLATRGLYQFEGLAKEKYYEVADITTRSLNGGQSLEAFGLTKNVTEESLREAQTISEFYTRLEAVSNEINNRYGDILKEKKIPSVWILVAADDSRELGRTVASLTQGIEKRVDIDRLCEYLDNPKLDAAYLKEWKKRREEMAHLMRMLDVRLFEVWPSTTLPAIRAFADEKVKSNLKSKSGSSTSAINALKKSRFYRLLINADTARLEGQQTTQEKTAHEFLRVQKLARTADKKLNVAMADAIKKALESESIEATVTAEKSSMQGNLKPDILVETSEKMVCLELTWRTMGRGIPGELEAAQNTLTIGHIQQYLLEKVIDYVNDLGL